jgi:hypothetical protein
MTSMNIDFSSKVIDHLETWVRGLVPALSEYMPLLGKNGVYACLLVLEE